MEKTYNIEFSESEIDVANNIFKIMSKSINKQLGKAQDVKTKKSKELDCFFSVINKFYNVKK